MKPGMSFWLRIAVTTFLAVAISASPLSRAYADKLPIKEFMRPALMGEPEIPEGTLPDRLETALSPTAPSSQFTALRDESNNRRFWSSQSLVARILLALIAHRN